MHNFLVKVVTIYIILLCRFSWILRFININTVFAFSLYYNSLWATCQIKFRSNYYTIPLINNLLPYGESKWGWENEGNYLLLSILVTAAFQLLNDPYRNTSEHPVALGQTMVVCTEAQRNNAQPDQICFNYWHSKMNIPHLCGTT